MHKSRSSRRSFLKLDSVASVISHATKQGRQGRVELSNGGPCRKQGGENTAPGHTEECCIKYQSPHRHRRALNLSIMASTGTRSHKGDPEALLLPTAASSCAPTSIISCIPDDIAAPHLSPTRGLSRPCPLSYLNYSPALFLLVLPAHEFLPDSPPLPSRYPHVATFLGHIPLMTHALTGGHRKP